MKNLFNHSKNTFGLRNKKNFSGRRYYSQFVALFYIRNTKISLYKDVTEVLRILKELENLNLKSRLIFKTNCSLMKHNIWESILSRIYDNLRYIKMQLEYIKENTTTKNKFNSFIFWQQNQVYIDAVTENYKKLEYTGFQILPKEDRLYWRTSICNFHDEIFSLIISLINICKQQLDFIEKYTPADLNIFTQDIIKNIPKDYTLKEAQKYEKEYSKALIDYKNEFNTKKNLWDTLLNILAGGRHQSPSEHVMLERWIDGKDER